MGGYARKCVSIKRGRERERMIEGMGHDKKGRERGKKGGRSKVGGRGEEEDGELGVGDTGPV